MDIDMIKSILEAHTTLVRHSPYILVRDGAIDLKIVVRSTRLPNEDLAESQGFTLVRFPGVSVGVMTSKAKVDRDKITSLLSLPPKKVQAEMTALEAMTLVPQDALDLGWRLRLAAFGNLVSGWILSRDGREVIWPLTVTTTPSAERDAIKAMAMLKKVTKKKDQAPLPKRRPKKPAE